MPVLAAHGADEVAVMIAHQQFIDSVAQFARRQHLFEPVQMFDAGQRRLHGQAQASDRNICGVRHRRWRGDTLHDAMCLPGARTIAAALAATDRSEEHTSELQSLMRISYAVFCLKKKKQQKKL